MRPVEERLCHVDQRHLGHDEYDQDEEECGRGVNLRTWLRPVNGRAIPIAAAAVGTSIIGRLGRLRKKGIRRVRIT
jgi:hypothetical protein